MKRSTNANGNVGETRNQVILGDCRTVLRADNFPQVDLIHTSPPYNIDKAYKNYSDRLALDDYLRFVSEVAQALYGRLKNGGSLFWQTGYTSHGASGEEILPIDVITYPIFKEHGFYLKDRIIWRYFGGMGFKNKFKNQHETIFWYRKGDPFKPAGDDFNIDSVRESSREYDPRNNLLGKNPGNVWEVDRVAFGSSQQTSHIAVFPEEITERIVRSCSKRGDLVLDPFLGSGTTAKVARSLGRDYVGIELSKEYHSEALERIGTQQFGEAKTIASVFIKHFLRSHGGKARKRECGEYLAQLLSSAPTDHEVQLAEYVESITENVNVPKDTKPDIWRFSDDFLEHLQQFPTTTQGVLANTMVAYREAYKLAKSFNGIQLAATARRVVEDFLVETSDGKNIDRLIDHVVDGEPSSYNSMSNGSISLKERAMADKTRSFVRSKRPPLPQDALF